MTKEIFENMKSRNKDNNNTCKKKKKKYVLPGRFFTDIGDSQDSKGE